MGELIWRGENDLEGSSTMIEKCGNWFSSPPTVDPPTFEGFLEPDEEDDEEMSLVGGCDSVTGFICRRISSSLLKQKKKSMENQCHLSEGILLWGQAKFWQKLGCILPTIKDLYDFWHYQMISKLTASSTQ